jgi:V/A-type H+-transporting ATPase subunit G/H
MEDILKRLLVVEMEAEDQVQQADAERRKMIQDALDQARLDEIEFEKRTESRRKPFLAAAEDGAQRRIAELESATVARQRMLREQAAGNEEAAISATLSLILGEA